MSRHVHLEDDCTLRFPGRSDEFAEGVEVGILAAQMDLGLAPLARSVGTANVEQVRSLARRLGYRVLVGTCEAGWTRLELYRATDRPALRIVRGA
jgi:hypothetical protein